MRLNYGCGETKLDGYVNIDATIGVKPDLVWDLKLANLPYEDSSIDEICMFHCLEHIEVEFWPKFFMEFWRLLKPDHPLLLAYPEFEVCAHNFITNKDNLKDFWRATLYGRQLYPGDYHVSPVISHELKQDLMNFGFKNIKYRPEIGEPYNTFLVCAKGEMHYSHEDLLNLEVFGIDKLTKL